LLLLLLAKKLLLLELALLLADRGESLLLLEQITLILVFLETLHQCSHMLQDNGSLTISALSLASTDLSNGLQESVLVTEVGLHKVMQSMLLLDDLGAIPVACQLSQQTNSRSLYATNR